MAKLVPLGDRVIMVQVEGEEKTPGGLLLPDNAQKPPPHGIVVAVGPGKRMENGEIQKMVVEVGHKVLFSELMARVTKIGDEEFIVIKEGDIYAIIE